MRPSRFDHLQCHPCGGRQTVLCLGQLWRDRLVCVSVWRAWLQTRGRGSREGAITSVSGTKDNPHLRRGPDCHRHLLVRNSAGTALGSASSSSVAAENLSKYFRLLTESLQQILNNAT